MHPENPKYSAETTVSKDSTGSIHSIHYFRKRNNIGDGFSSAIFYLAILFFFIGFNFSDVMVGNWYQQFMPDLNGRTISDIFFLDSLTGYAVTNNLSPNDTGYILKTNNGGNNWNINLILNRNLTTVKYINSSTGFVCGGSGGGTAYLYKTTNSGANWNIISTPGATSWRGLSLVDEDTIWLVDNDSFVGGVFRTTNGGASWEPQFSGGNQNPNKIYMYNARIGFMSNSSAEPNIYKTTNGGVNWNVNVSGQYMRDVYFIDSLTGWYSYSSNVYKTINGGNNWITQFLPRGGNIITTGINRFSILNSDTILGVGGEIIVGVQTRGIIYRTINSGQNWTFQIPDTSIYVPGPYNYLQFVNSKNGWAYTLGFYGGIHTTTGGDPVWITDVEQISTEVPTNFQLFQNYPNPFNPVTHIGFRIADFGFVTLEIFDLTGKEVSTLINKELRPGEYRIDWNASDYSSGVYFYKLTVTNGKEVFTDTKKLILLK
ncbi:MAG: T9SS type A sorting domain-containing protein [Ignavibacteria bacterium]|nr:T9SS type A sorting domain-containing protein [Ignavibacteria bacterium]